MDTFELLPTLAQGDIVETSAPELVAAVFRSRASGTLWIETPQGHELRVYFRAGDMCGAAPSEGFHTLAHVLLANDWVSALEIDSTREEAAASAKRHGEVLVAKGLLSPDQLRAALHAQHVANLATLLGVAAGKYEWRGWETPPAWAREVADPAMGLVTALESDKHAPRRKKVLDWLGDVPAQLSVDWEDLHGRLTFEAAEQRAAAMLSLPRTTGEFVQASRLAPARGEALLASLLLVGAAEPKRVEAPAAPPPSRAAAPLPPLTAPPPLAQPRTTPPSQPRAQEARTASQPAPARSLSPAATPRVQQPASDGDLLDLVLEPLPEEGQRRAPPPSRPVEDDLLTPLPAPADFPGPELQPADTELLPSLELDTAPRQTAEGRAMREDVAMAQLDALLLDDEPPLEIDTSRRPQSHGGSFEQPAQPRQGADEASARELRKKLLARGLRNLGGGPSQGAPVEAPAEPRPSDASPQAVSMTDDERRFSADAQDRLRRAPQQNAYARLGVSQNATTEAIKAAYLSAAKQFHPDRASGGLASMQGDLEDLFSLLKEAYESISTRDARERYDQDQRSGGGSGPSGGKAVSRREEAGVLVKMGEVLLKKRDFEGSIAKFRRAVELDASGDALAALAWALVADPKATPATKEEAATLINKALRAEGATGRTYYVAGVLWRTKDPDSAVDAFRKALEIDPKNADAALELRLLEQRRGKQQKTGGGVLSGLLFGKRKG